MEENLRRKKLPDEAVAIARLVELHGQGRTHGRAAAATDSASAADQSGKLPP